MHIARPPALLQPGAHKQPMHAIPCNTSQRSADSLLGALQAGAVLPAAEGLGRLGQVARGAQQ